MDCFGSQPFRAEDAYGEIVAQYMYNATGGVRYGKTGYIEAQAVLSKRVRELTAQRGATHLYGNNVDSDVNAPILLKPRELLDGGALEGFIGGSPGPCGTLAPDSFTIMEEAKWVQHVSQVQNVSQQGLPIMPMTGSAGCESTSLVGSPHRKQIEDFAYATFLLAAEVEVAMFGIVPYTLRNESAGAAGGFRMHLDDRYFLPLGPAKHLSADLEGYRIAPCTYARHYATALVLVNPSTNCTDDAVALNSTWIDPETQDRLTHLKMQPQHGHVLIKA